MDISILLQRNQYDCDLQTLSDKEKQVLFQYTIIVARSINQLIKILKISASIAEEYSEQESKLSKFVRDWHTFVKVNEERLVDITNSIDKDLPPLIKSFVSQVTSDYCADTRFVMLESAILNYQMVKRDIIWGLAKLPIPSSVKNIIHPTATKSKPPRADIPVPGGCRENKDITNR